MAIPESVRRYLDAAGVRYETFAHERAIAAQQVAHAQHVSGKRLAKPVMVRLDGAPAMAVLPAHERVNLESLKAAAGAQEARLMHEDEFQELFPGCEKGAEPPLGGLFKLPVWVDEALARDENIVFRGGTHTDTIGLRYADWARLEQPRAAAFGQLAS